MGPLLPRTNDSDPCLGVRGASGPANMCHRRFFRGEALAFTVFLCFSCFKEQELHLQSAEIMYTLMPFRITHGKSKKMNMCFRNQTVCFRNQTVRFRNQTVHFLELDCADSGNDRADSEIRLCRFQNQTVPIPESDCAFPESDCAFSRSDCVF
jgi:hypothetical protein